MEAVHGMVWIFSEIAQYKYKSFCLFHNLPIIGLVIYYQVSHIIIQFFNVIPYDTIFGHKKIFT